MQTLDTLVAPSSRKHMRILVTCDRYPGPPWDGLTLRVYQYVKRLRGKYIFDLVCLDDTTESAKEVDELFDQVVRFPFPDSKEDLGPWSRVRAALSPSALFPSSPESMAYFESLRETSAYDLIWDAGGNMLLNLMPLRGHIPLLVDQVDDAFIRIRQELLAAGSLRHKAWLLKHYCLTWIFNSLHISNADAVLFVAALDAQSFKKNFPKANVIVIENGVDEVFFSSSTESVVSHDEKPRPELVFEGSMYFSPNIDAAEYFTKDIFPLIQEQVPDAHFTLVGRDPVTDVVELAGDNVTVTGTVADVRPYLRRADVFVCPMRLGTGIKNKILQAWAMGLPIVSTLEGVGNLLVEDNKNMLVRNEPESFAAAVVRLLRDKQQAERMGREGRMTIEHNYTWDVKAEQLDKLIECMAAGHACAD